ncbi:HigA family addiction module antitoxin [Aequorivita marina]|uniref:HigA family addiction module antitoxin n=1 Tax=Aequorivita marina TaxID=3073654 RepID=UPI00287427DC|nr:HigA family addiction module antitoxin [Aequorivita sp. S2608]MDS1297879.1 HigA family addiction module antitoxin [Aequorivita sp. S2608]
MSLKENQYYPEVVTHPGFTLGQKLEELGMGPKEFAIRVDKPQKTISEILSGQSSITSEMAVKFEDVLKIPASFWLKRQQDFDEAKARMEREEIVKNASSWARLFPYAKMAAKGWVPKTRKVEEKVKALFSFFQVSTHEAWERYYFEKALLVEFRISLAHANKPYAVAAWLRQGELQAASIETQEYDSKRLRASLPEIKKIMATQPEDFFNRLQKICANAGVKVVYTPCLPGAPIHGSTRWLGNTPLIQLSARYKTNDKFWFTFFHEVGHILLHGKKFISIENVSYDGWDSAKEKEADDFAVAWTFTQEEEEEVLSQVPLSPEDIMKYAREFGTHPAMIIGRLQHKKLLPYYKGREFIEAIELEEG